LGKKLQTVPVDANTAQTISSIQFIAFSALDKLPPYIFRWHAKGKIAAMEYEKHDPSRLCNRWMGKKYS
jgi:hypothetical protein